MKHLDFILASPIEAFLHPGDEPLRRLGHEGKDLGLTLGRCVSDLKPPSFPHLDCLHEYTLELVHPWEFSHHGPSAFSELGATTLRPDAEDL